MVELVGGGPVINEATCPVFWVTDIHTDSHHNLKSQLAKRLSAYRLLGNRTYMPEHIIHVIDCFKSEKPETNILGVPWGQASEVLKLLMVIKRLGSLINMLSDIQYQKEHKK